MISLDLCKSMPFKWAVGVQVLISCCSSSVQVEPFSLQLHPCRVSFWRIDMNFAVEPV